MNGTNQGRSHMSGLLPKREDFKFNFLKQIIVRIDFQGVLESELEGVLPKIKSFLSEENFVRYTQKTSNDVNMALSNENNSLPEVSRVVGRVVHSFQDKNGFVIDISNNFICLNIRPAFYQRFEVYAGIAEKLINILKNQISFFTPIRVGVRKINQCLLKEKKTLNKFFNKTYYPSVTFDTDVPNANTMSCMHRTIMEVGRYIGNLNCNLISGKANDLPIFQILLDIDIYKAKAKSETDIGEYCLTEMNEIIFRLFVGALTPDFRLLLCESDPDNFDEIEGIKPND